MSNLGDTDNKTMIQLVASYNRMIQHLDVHRRKHAQSSSVNTMIYEFQKNINKIKSAFYVKHKENEDNFQIHAKCLYAFNKLTGQVDIGNPSHRRSVSDAYTRFPYKIPRSDDDVQMYEAGSHDNNGKLVQKRTVSQISKRIRILSIHKAKHSARNVNHER